MQCNVVRLTFGCGPDDIDGEISVLDINVDLDTKHCVYIVHIWRKSSSTSIPTQHTHIMQNRLYICSYMPDQLQSSRMHAKIYVRLCIYAYMISHVYVLM